MQNLYPQCDKAAWSQNMSVEVQYNFIAGQLLANDSGETFDVVNPATGQLAYRVQVADEKFSKRPSRAPKRLCDLVCHECH